MRNETTILSANAWDDHIWSIIFGPKAEALPGEGNVEPLAWGDHGHEMSLWRQRGLAHEAENTFYTSTSVAAWP